MNLVVITTFLSELPGILRQVGEWITDAEEIAAILERQAHYVVQVADDPSAPAAPAVMHDEVQPPASAQHDPDAIQ